MLTSLQKQKQEHFFKLIDVDKNQFLEPEDWTEIGKRLAKARGISEGTAEHESIINTANVLWGDLSQFVEGEEKNRASLGEWINFVDQKIVGIDQELYDQYVSSVVKGIFAIMDEDKNGTIESSEYIEFMSCFGLDESNAKLAFEKMDLNNDGTLDESELVQSVAEFFRSDDSESNGNWLFGPF